MQALVLVAAINGDQEARARLPAVCSGFEEPYRTVATVVNDRVQAGEFQDRRTIGSALAAYRLTRCASNGVVQTLTVEQVLGLIFATEARPGQARAYLDELVAGQQAKQAVDLKETAIRLAESYGNQPEQLLDAIQRVVSDARRTVRSGLEAYPSEVLEVISYTTWLMAQQTAADFLGLDSGFPHLNNLCNGLDTGLSILAAPPGRGKTTLLWQVGCQAAEINRVPVLFVSMEQSKRELRAKALARLSKLQYRHILRGRLRSDEPQDQRKLLDAATQYARLAQHLTILEGDDKTTVDVIQRVAVEKMARAEVSRCLIVVDYLQILPTAVSETGKITNAKDRVDLHVSALRRLARKIDSPVLAISAENRAGYRAKGLDVFKESGGIEYSADVAMVLTLDKKNDPGRSGEYRTMDLNIIKNRNGERGVVKLKFYPKRAEFAETGKEDLVEEGEE